MLVCSVTGNYSLRYVSYSQPSLAAFGAKLSSAIRLRRLSRLDLDTTLCFSAFRSRQTPLLWDAVGKKRGEGRGGEVFLILMKSSKNQTEKDAEVARESTVRSTERFEDAP